MDNLKEMNQEVLENIHKPITSNETETVIKNRPAEVQDLMASQANSIKHFFRSNTLPSQNSFKEL